MKKLIGLVIASMIFANIGFAEMRLIEERTIKVKNYKNSISTVCIDGYKFVFMRTGLGPQGRAQSIVQFFERKITVDGKLISVPSYC